MKACHCEARNAPHAHGADCDYYEPRTPAEDPADALRAIWDEKGVTRERQAELLAQIEAKGKAGISFAPSPAPLKPINKGQMALL